MTSVGMASPRQSLRRTLGYLEHSRGRNAVFPRKVKVGGFRCYHRFGGGPAGGHALFLPAVVPSDQWGAGRLES
jgi:hypothetical protein